MPKPNVPRDEKEIARRLQQLGVSDTTDLDDETIAAILQEDEEVNASSAPEESTFKPFSILSALMHEGKGLPTIQDSRQDLFDEDYVNNNNAAPVQNLGAGQLAAISDEETQENEKSAYLEVFSQKAPELTDEEIQQLNQSMESWDAFADDSAPNAAESSDTTPKAAK